MYHDGEGLAVADKDNNSSKDDGQSRKDLDKYGKDKRDEINRRPEKGNDKK
jgi:hypothetical protein